MVAIVNKTRKEQIFEIATQLFKERGFSATSMRDLAKQVGLEPASLYSHFKSKEEILSKICFGIASQFYNAIKPITQKNLPANEKLRQALEAHIDVIINNVDAAAVFLYDWKFLNDNNLNEFLTLRKNYEAIFIDLIKNGIQQGVFRDVNEKFLMMNIFSAMNWVYEWYSPTGPMTAEEIANNLTNFILNGIIKL